MSRQPPLPPGPPPSYSHASNGYANNYQNGYQKGGYQNGYRDRDRDRELDRYHDSYVSQDRGPPGMYRFGGNDRMPSPPRYHSEDRRGNRGYSPDRYSPDRYRPGQNDYRSPKVTNLLP